MTKEQSIDMKKLFRITILALVFMAFNGCRKKEKLQENITYQFVDYIATYPKEIISTTDYFDFYLNKPVAVTNPPEDVFTISPNIDGTVVLVDGLISFRPTKPLESNATYEVTLHLDKLYGDVDKDLKEFTTTIKTKELLYTVVLKSPKLYDKNWNYVEGYINASDVIEASKLERLISAKYIDKNIPVKFDVSEGRARKINFIIDSIQRNVDDKLLEVNWNGKEIGSASKGDRAITITGKSNFKILDVVVKNEPSKHIELVFSDPLKSSQNLKGLIEFTNTYKSAFTYKLNKNIVSIYPKSTSNNAISFQVFKEIKNEEGYTLKQNFEKSIVFEDLKPTVSFIKSGTILPDSKNLKINFNAVNLRAVDATIYKIYKNNVLQFLQQNNLSNQGNLRQVGRPVVKYTINLSNQGLELDKINAFAFDLAEIIDVEAGAMYRVELSFTKEHSNYPCDGKRPTNAIIYGKKEVDINNYNDNYRYYRWNDREKPCTESFYYDKRYSTNILATNIAAIIKKGNNNTTFVAVTDILTTKPVVGAKVELFSYQQQVITAATTKSDGFVNFTGNEDAYFAKISKDKNVTYIKLNDGNALSMSKFNVSGARLQKGIKGFIYAERGVWRPGNQLFLTFVLNDNANPLPEKHPIKFELSNPQGKIVDRKVVYKTAENMYAYAPKTDEDALTGNWNVKVSVGGAIFQKTLKVETIKPNRLKIKLKTAEELVTANKPIEGDVEVKWLHGATAKGLKLDINAKFRQTKTSFENFDNYNFDDFTRNFSTEDVTVLEGNLDEEGKTSFSLQPNLEKKAPGMLKASFVTKVYENGGDFSTDVFSQKISPYKTYAGLNVAEEKESRNYLFTDQNYSFNTVSVTEKGKAKTSNLKVNVYKLTWRWWWSSSSSRLSYYDGSKHVESYKDFEVKTGANGKGSFDLKIDKNDWGRYLVKVTDKESGHTTANVVYFDWPYWYGSKSNNKDKTNANMLVFTTDKEEYIVNEKAKVKFPSSAGSRALITIENGTEVLDNFWVETTDKQTVFEFPITEKYTPNVFVNISLIQKHSQTKNDLPIRMYGSVPVLVYDPATKLNPEIQMADEFRPESKAKFRIKEKDGKAMTYTVAIVDEGLLDLTRFKTPNPWNTFYAKQSLGVKTWDVFDDIIGAYGGEINQILSIGGDESEAGSKNKKANRFKPMVRFLGPFTLTKGETAYHEVLIPQYIGSVKAMVIATNAKEEAYGSTEKTAFVRKPVMILASLPRKITPQETVTLPVTVFAMKPEIKKVKVTLTSNESYTIVGDKTQTITFSEPEEKMAYFKLKVNDFKGIGKIKIDAVSGNESATYAIEIDVLNPNPITTEVKDLVLSGKEKGALSFTSFGTKGTNTASIELSTLPPMNFTKRLEYLIRYPHGCVEQTTSSAFPQLFLSEIFELPKEKQNSIERNIKAAIVRLSNFQLSNGGMAYWQGGNYVSDWGTSYAGHFIIEASKKGYALPIGFKENWVLYQKQTAKNWRYKKPTSSYYYSSRNSNALAQAYRLYTLSLANSPDLASMNRLREIKDIPDEAKMRLATAYALLGKTSIAENVLKTVSGTNYSRPYYYGYGSETRNKAMALETYVLMKDSKEAIKLAKDIAEKLSSNNWMSTQTTAFSLLAMAKYALQNGKNSGVQSSFSINGNKGNITTTKSLYIHDLENLKKDNSLQITNDNNGVLYVRLFNSGILPVGQEKTIQSNLTATVSYKTKDGTIIQPDNLIQGTNFVAEVIIKNTTSETTENIALTQYIPSGWEIINTRFTDFGNSTNSAAVDYTDIRDASISNYFTLKKYETKKFTVLLNASYLGEYYLPGVQCEAMYDNEYLVRTKGRWIKVVK